ncbi:MAG TPA: MFS transporter [Deinococcales bacterium]|nr:MFS transporter [Deinococcales bacterium]
MFAAVLSAGSAFFTPAFRSVGAHVAGDEHAVRANAALLTTSAIARAVGPGLGGVLVASVGPAAAVAANLASYLLSAILLLGVALPRREASTAPAERGSFARDLLGGIEFARANRAVGAGILFFACLNFFWAPLTPLLPGYAAGELSAGPSSFGLLPAALPAGLVLGGLAASRLSRRFGSGLAWMAVVGSGTLYALLAVAPSLPGALALLAAQGFLIALADVAIVAAVQARTPAALRGRVFGLANVIAVALNPLALALLAPVVGNVGIRPTYLACGAAIGLVGCVMALRAPATTARTREAPAH